MKQFGYVSDAIVSVSIDEQIAAISERFSVDLLHVEAGDSQRRTPKLDWMIECLRPGDLVVLYSIFCFGLSAARVAKALEAIGRADAHLVSLNEGVDSRLPGHLQLLRRIIWVLDRHHKARRGRIKRGLVKARSKGKSLGRPKVIPAKINLAKTLLESGDFTVEEAARQLRISARTIYRSGITKGLQPRKKRKAAPKDGLR